jgi:hypothetical protein
VTSNYGPDTLDRPINDRLPIAIRVYPEPVGTQRKSHKFNKWRQPTGMLVFDTETRTDATQALTFGSYRLIVGGKCLEEGIFYGDDLPDMDRQVIEKYVATHAPQTARGGSRELKLLSRSKFVDKLFEAAYKARYLLIAFNFPFDISRIAWGFSESRERFKGGFSFHLWSYFDAQGHEQVNKYRPSIIIKHLDSKRALKRFTDRLKPDKEDLIPEDSETAKPAEKSIFRGHFIDCRTLAFALTDTAYTLETACKSFGVEHGKQKATRHGVVSEEYIDYNRRDVLATSELAVKLLQEYNRHPIDLQPTKAYSPASIGKAYLRRMGIKPILERQPDFPKEYLGYAQSAFFGGRTSAHIRKVAVPVVYTDFLSMYPTVNSLMGLWRFVTAYKIQVEHCAEEILALLNGITLERLFDPETWKHFAGFVKIIPDGDILPSRSQYDGDTSDWQVAINYLSGDTDNSRHALWFSLPDVIVSRILTGRVPQVLDAFRLERVSGAPAFSPESRRAFLRSVFGDSLTTALEQRLFVPDKPVQTARGLKPVRLRGAIGVNPTQQDFFKVVIEQRKLLGSRTDLSDADRERLDKALKVLANSASYGIYAEMIRQESEKKVKVVCRCNDSEPYECRVVHPEKPGEFCFPPMASLITGGARLMLALLEKCVSDLGGTYAMEDTDSMAIVATERGGLVPCPSGPRRAPNGTAAINALSWKEVEQIAKKFEALNPYNREAVPGSILKIENDNYEGGKPTQKQRQLYCVAISAKRYALFLKDERGEPILLRKRINSEKDHWKQHGLGHLLNPTDPESPDRQWIAQVWLGIVRRALGLQTETLVFEKSPAVGRVSVSSPTLMKALADLNAGKKYTAQIKPFNFLLTSQVAPAGHPEGANNDRFRLIAPYESDSRKWLKTDWIDQYTGSTYRITTDGYHGGESFALVKTYGKVLQEYARHPESKCGDDAGNACSEDTLGLLQRRHVHIGRIRRIGKESNKLEAVLLGEISPRDVSTEYPHPVDDEWHTEILPAVKKAQLTTLINESGMSKRALMDIRAERSTPQPKNRELLARIVRTLGLI